MELEHDIRVRRANLGHFGGEVGLIQLGIDLAGDLALEEALEPVERVLAGLIVRREDERLLVAEVGGVLAGALVRASRSARTRRSSSGGTPCQRSSRARHSG